MRIEHLAEGVTLYCGDCREVLAGVALDIPTMAVVTDPPYGMGDLLRKGGKKKWSVCGNLGTDWDDHPADVQFIVDMGCPAIVWGGQFFPLPRQRGWLVWDKMMSEFSTSVCELAWTNIEQPVKRITVASGMVQIQGRVHPTQKPVEVMRWCLGFIDPSLMILDPYMGSGTTGVAAVQLGRRFTGVEIHPPFFETACRRIADELKRPRLALDPPKPAAVQEALL